ncbi:hypothetical protein ABMA70_11180 [Halobacteriovorax sp. XZX-3]|uniref:hypothetical protein n=1 Tax=unclassified Halobacteriovorax TaxID=2639665 RepID=UPI000CD0D66A|nr:hypothetical protein [Halobacteriovorax sp. DA5]POB13899.1 hypothetical protein C0Z22_07510 [Halobacteriovorax sp. DA5]
MKQVLLVVIISLIAFASEGNLDSFCASKKGDTGHYKSGSNYYIFKGPFLYKFEEEQIRLIFSKYEIRSVKEYKGKLYILTPDYVFVHNLNNYEFVTSFPSTHLPIIQKHQSAQDMTIMNDKLFIAHGSLGLMKIDLSSYNVESAHNFDLPHDSSQVSTATGIDNDGKRIFVMLDNVTYNFSTKKRAFEGLVILDENMNQDNVLSIRQNREALHMPKAVIHNGFLISKNIQNLYFYEISELNKIKSLWPKRRLYDFAGDDLASTPAIVDGKVYGCFNQYDGLTFKYFHREFKL